MTQEPVIPLAVKVETAAKMLEIGASTMRKLIAAGEIKSIKRGSTRRVIVASLQEWIELHTVTR